MRSREYYASEITGKPQRRKNRRKAKPSSSCNRIRTNANVYPGGQENTCKNEKRFRWWLIALTALLSVVPVTSSFRSKQITN